MTLLLFLIFVVLLIGPQRTMQLLGIAASVCVAGFALLLLTAVIIN